MRITRIIGILALLGGLATVACAQEADVEERQPNAKLTAKEADRLLTTGRAALEDGMYRMARHRLGELLAGAPDRKRQVEAALWLARTHCAEQNPRKALAVLHDHAPQVRGAAMTADYALTTAQAQFALGEWASAAEGLEAFKEKYAEQPMAPAALHLLAQVQVAQTNWAAARETADMLTARWADAPDMPAAWFHLATALAAAGQTNDALSAFQFVATNQAGQVWGERAELQVFELKLRMGEYPPTRELVQTLQTNGNLSAEARARGYQVVAESMAAETNYTQALQMMDKALAATTDPATRLASQAQKAYLLVCAGQTQAGILLMREVVTQLPDPAQAAQWHLRMAAELAVREQWTEAAAEYQVWLDAFERMPGTAAAREGLADALLALGRFSEAAAAYSRAVVEQTNATRRLLILQQQGDAHFAAGEFQSAHAAYLSALEAPPPAGEETDRILYQLAETELAMDDIAAGEIRLLELSRAATDSAFIPKAIMRLGELYDARGAGESAIEQYSRLTQTNTASAIRSEALFARGMIRYRMGLFPEALADFTRIRDELPETPPAAQAMFMRGWCLYMLGKDVAALQVCQQFLEDYPNSEFVPDVHFWLGEYAFNHGDFAGAEERFVQLATDHPKSPRAADALFWAGRAAVAARHYLAANEHFNHLMERYPDYVRLAETLLAQGDVLSELGQFPAAILAFNEVIVRFPQQPEAWVAWGRKGDCQFTLGQENPARYEEALLSYRTLADSAGAPFDLRLQARFKTGRSLEKMGRPTAALDRYLEVVYAFLQEPKPDAEATVWFTRAAFSAAGLQEKAGRWNEAYNIYRRVSDSGVAAASEARARMTRIRQDHWNLF